MRSFILGTLLVVAGAGSWWLWNHNAQFRNIIGEYVDNGEFLTLEARYTPQQIMDGHKKELLASTSHSFQEPELRFYPYVLLEIKYTQADRKSREGVILWSLVDGELVINSDTWEQTHGFEDAIKANATIQEFKVINALAKNNGTLSRDQLQNELHLERDLFEPWIESARQKHLVTVRGDLIQLHFQDPKLITIPQTKINQRLVSKPYNHAQRVNPKYSERDVENIAKAAFGSDFTIRNATKVFLPVYSIEVANPDGSTLTSYWNALNGQRIQPRYLAER